MQTGISGALNFGFGLLLGNQGFYNTKHGLLQRTYLKQVLLSPIDTMIEYIIDLLFGND